MQVNKIIKILAVLVVVSANIGCDQLSKSVVRSTVEPNAGIELVQDHVILTNVENTGAFLSLGAALPPTTKLVLLTVLPSLVLLLALVWLFKQPGLGNGVLFGLSCVLGGGIGNLFDRVVYGSVTDFLYVHFGFLRTGIFNFADVSITFGVVFLAVHQFMSLRTGPGGRRA